MWRLTKEKGSSPIRAATGGLAASDRMIPPSMMAPSAASIKRSTVHHHAENGVRSARETIGGLLPGLISPVLPNYGFQPVKKEFPISILLGRLDPAGHDDAGQLA